ncbi:hypothetical protein OUZ56_021416 [Daphnia magna]|uniref:Uncharacterized protein n=1 Tax=Daphnia magna TaxID=35525 RepID=A0ABQ9ZHB0_9CRUS|nr:hypothetical protein OUZ56_021416 [Daphnia magna]
MKAKIENLIRLEILPNLGISRRLRESALGLIRNLCEYYGETDSGSTDDDDVDQGTETEDELDEREPESDSGSTEDDDVDQGTESEDEFDG